MTVPSVDLSYTLHLYCLQAHSHFEEDESDEAPLLGLEGDVAWGEVEGGHQRPQQLLDFVHAQVCHLQQLLQTGEVYN